MRQRRDSFQRKISGMRRMVLAMDRQARASSATEKELAGQWAALWGAVAGIRRFPLEKPGKAVYKRRWHRAPRRKTTLTWISG
jgi:hypothetical protein